MAAFDAGSAGDLPVAARHVGHGIGAQRRGAPLSYRWGRDGKVLSQALPGVMANALIGGLATTLPPGRAHRVTDRVSQRTLIGFPGLWRGSGVAAALAIGNITTLLPAQYGDGAGNRIDRTIPD